MLFFTLLLLLNISLVVKTQLPLIVTWGSPSDWRYCYQYDTSNWDTCMDYCENDDNCIMVYLNSTLSICYTCEIGQVYEVQITSDSVFAFKANVSECSPTIEDSYETSDYAVTVSNSSWIFDYFNSSTCPDGWALSNRPNVQWCQFVFNLTDSLTYDQAVEYCNNEGAVLSGPDTLFEQQYLQRTSWTIYATTTWKHIFVDGKLIDDCLDFNENIYDTTGCTFPNGWIFLDQYIKNYTFYNWNSIVTKNATCAVLLSDEDDSTVDGYYQIALCYNPTVNGIVCGQLAA